MSSSQSGVPGFAQRVDGIPVRWVEPQSTHSPRRLVIFLHHLGGSKEGTAPLLQDLADHGYVALSFDAWQHGERGSESPQEILARVFGNFRRHMWPILGQTALDTLRVIDWAVDALNVEPRIVLGGLSMGGDVAVAVAGIDRRIHRVTAVVATPDWQRPGMEDVRTPGLPLPPGEPDTYAQYFYDHLNPMTHLPSYVHGPNIHFVCGQLDTHVPPDGAFRFQAALREEYPAATPDTVTVNLIPGMRHLDTRDTRKWWPNCLSDLTDR